MAYKLKLPEEMSGIHNVFHVSQLRKYVHDEASVVQPPSKVEVRPDLVYEKKPVGITAKKDKRLRHKIIKLVKVQWSLDPNDCTWEVEDKIKAQYPQLFAAAS